MPVGGVRQEQAQGPFLPLGRQWQSIVVAVALIVILAMLAAAMIIVIVMAVIVGVAAAAIAILIAGFVAFTFFVAAVVVAVISGCQGEGNGGGSKHGGEGKGNCGFHDWVLLEGSPLNLGGTNGCIADVT